MIHRSNYRSVTPDDPLRGRDARIMAAIYVGLLTPEIVTITERTPRGWWNGSPLIGTRDPHDVRAHAAEFRERMRVERLGPPPAGVRA